MIFIKELYPNPPGSDAGAEWIKLGNDGQETISLVGWKLKDASGKIYVFKTGHILGRSDVMVKNSETKVSLGNKGDEVFLYDFDGKLADSLSYGGDAREGAIISRTGDFYFTEGQNLIEEDVPAYTATIADVMPVSFWGTAVALGVVFAFTALFIVRRVGEES